VIREDVRDVQLRAGDMLVFHSIWTDLAQAAKSRDFVVVTDYPPASSARTSSRSPWRSSR
jgi:uncharacterized protein YjlB